MRSGIWFVCFTMLLALTVAPVPLDAAATAKDDQFEALKRYSQVLDLVEHNYVKPVTKAELIQDGIKGMEESWKPVHEVHIEVVRSEVNPQFAAIVPPSDVVIVITFEVELENAIGSLICCLPYATMSAGPPSTR